MWVPVKHGGGKFPGLHQRFLSQRRSPTSARKPVVSGKQRCPPKIECRSGNSLSQAANGDCVQGGGAAERHRRDDAERRLNLMPPGFKGNTNIFGGCAIAQPIEPAR